MTSCFAAFNDNFIALLTLHASGELALENCKTGKLQIGKLEPDWKTAWKTAKQGVWDLVVFAYLTSLCNSVFY